MTNPYQRAYDQSLSDPETFWGDVAQGIHWIKPWDKVLDDSRKPFYRWFSGALVNTCYNAVDRHVLAGRGQQAALIYDSPVTNTIQTITYAQLQDRVARLAGALKGLGVEKGDRVLVYMPMVPEAAMAMLACARLGAIHSVVFGGFAPQELATRIDDATPKVILTASCGIDVDQVIPYKPLLDQGIRLATHQPSACVVLARPQCRAELQAGRDHDWATLVGQAAPAACVPVAATDPLYILYTSGTTGQPKGIARDNGGHLVALTWTMSAIYDVKPGEVFWTASDVGWVIGHCYTVYAPLFHGATSVLYEGKSVGTPDAAAFWRVIAQHKVASLITAPTALRAIKREDPALALLAGYDVSSLRSLFLMGERSDPDTITWIQRGLGVPIIDHWSQTEVAWPIAANCLGLHPFPVKPGSPTKAVPGWNLQVLDDDHSPCPPGRAGALVLKLPLAPGSFYTLWNAEQRFFDDYLAEYPGYHKTSDFGYLDEEGYAYIMSRADDIITVAENRFSAGTIEEILSAHPDVAECAVIAVADAEKGQVPVGLICLKAGVTNPSVLPEVIKCVRDALGDEAAFKKCVVVKRLPKTRSGKILRSTMRKIADGQAYKLPATLDDPAILPEITLALLGTEDRL